VKRQRGERVPGSERAERSKGRRVMSLLLGLPRRPKSVIKND